MNDLIKKAEALSKELSALETTNPAAWKARRKVDAAIAILKTPAPALIPETASPEKN